ncbi:hypothetical protein AHAS_Ahas10G0034600 [Arachis hypogaea]
MDTVLREHASLDSMNSLRNTTQILQVQRMQPKYKTFIFLAGSTSTEVIADIALYPMKAVKVRVQTQPGFARDLSNRLPKFIKAESARGYT